jgi:hypothetical protein
MAHLYIDKKIAIEANKFESWFNEQRTEIIPLSEGKHTIDIAYRKNTNWIPTALGLFVEGNGIHYQPLHALGSIPLIASEGAVYLNPEQRPRLLRSFMFFKGEKRTHVISVGEISKINYAYDLSQGTLMQVWRGDFLDVTGMWQDRGGSQVAAPIGNPMELFSTPTLFILNNTSASWTSQYKESDGFKQKGYDLDDSGRPTFKYMYQGIAVEDKITPIEENKALSRELLLTASQAVDNLYAKVAEGREIAQLPDGAYSIDDKQYYIQISEFNKAKAFIRQNGDKKELLTPVTWDGNKAKVQYAIIW